jgi:hypothetical protein
MEKILEAMNALQQQAAAMYGELMSMSGKISEALSIIYSTSCQGGKIV